MTLTRNRPYVVCCALFVAFAAAPVRAQEIDGSVDAGLTLDAEVAQDAAWDAGDASLESEPLAPEPDIAMLPPAAPDPEIAPIVVEQPLKPSAAERPVASEDRPTVVIGTLLGLLGLLALSYLGGHARVQAFERRFGMSQVMTAGFPFVLLGLVARTPAVGLLNDSLLADLSPLLRIGLGCIGFVAGFRFTAQFRGGANGELLKVAAFATVVPFALVAALSGALLLAWSGGLNAASLRDPVFIRDAIILGTAGAMTARTSAEVFRAGDADRVLARVLRFEELAGIAGLAIIAAYFRPSEGATWQLPGTAWLLLTAGLGATLGAIAWLIFKRPQEGPEFVVLVLGVVGFASGIAGYLRLSPVVVAFLVGACLALSPAETRERLRVAFRRLERPIYLLSLLVIGALWRIDDARGWLLVPVFTGARLAGKWLGMRLATHYAEVSLSSDERQVLAVSPMGPLAIAIVVNAQLLYPGGSISPIVAAVIGGAIVTEVVVQLASRRNGTRAVQAEVAP